jgi:hypothetical protein
MAMRSPGSRRRDQARRHQQLGERIGSIRLEWIFPPVAPEHRRERLGIAR